MAKRQKNMIKVMGQWVRKGSKKEQALTYQKKLFDQIPFNQR